MSHVSRRSLVRGAAWAVPVVSVASASPALAASPCDVTIPPFPSTGTTGNGWSIVEQNAPRKDNARFASGGRYIVEADPQTGTTHVVSAVLDAGVYLEAGATYTFTYTYDNFVNHPRSMTQQLFIDGQAVSGSLIDTSNSGMIGTRVVTYTATSTGFHSFALTNTAVGAASGNPPSDDIKISSVTATCERP